MLKHLASTCLAAATCAVVAMLPAPAAAQFEGRTVDEVVQVSLIEGWRLENGRHMAGIHIELAPGWKTYWRAPGEGGVPTVLRLRSAEGIDGMAIHWPRPEVFFTNGIRSIGYRDDVVLPVEFALSGAGPHRLEGRLEFGVCLDVCMPVTLDLSGELLARHNAGQRHRHCPVGPPAVGGGGGCRRCPLHRRTDFRRVARDGHGEVPPTGNDETLVVEHRDPQIWVSEAMTQRNGSTVTGIADVVPSDHGPFAMNRSDLRITLIGTQMAVELDGCRG
jgi:hypothetical protein